LMRASISLEFKSEQLASQALLTIEPDNTPLPEGLEIRCGTDAAVLHIKIETSRSIESLMATMEDILSAIDLYLRATSVVRHHDT